MQLHQLKRKTPNKKSRQVGRGGTRGKTSGRGTKGQKSRSGHKIRPESRDLIKKIPKLRGRGKNIFHSFQADSIPLNVFRLEAAFSSGDVVNPKTLAEKGVVHTLHGLYQNIKILSQGDITKALIISGCKVSAGARAKIEKAGGKVEEMASTVVPKKVAVKK